MAEQERAATERMAGAVEQTGYPHIIRMPGPAGERFVIEGTELDVWALVELYYRDRLSVEQIVARWSFLTPAQVFSALTYYLDHPGDIEMLFHEQAGENWREHYIRQATGRVPVGTRRKSKVA